MGQQQRETEPALPLLANLARELQQQAMFCPRRRESREWDGNQTAAVTAAKELHAESLFKLSLVPPKNSRNALSVKC